MTFKQCPTCREWTKRYPEDFPLTIYFVHQQACPRCQTTEFTEIETDAWPRYFGAPEPPKTPQKRLF